MVDILLKLVGSLSFGRFAQPQVMIFYKPGSSSSGVAPGASQGIECDWKGHLVFENLTDLVAVNLEILRKPAGLVISSVPQNSLKPYGTFEVKTVIRKSFPREIVVACRNRFVELLPDEITNLHLIISYQNTKGTRFYTRYRKNHTENPCSYHFLKPKLAETPESQLHNSGFVIDEPSEILTIISELEKKVYNIGTTPFSLKDVFKYLAEPLAAGITSNSIAFELDEYAAYDGHIKVFSSSHLPHEITGPLIIRGLVTVRPPFGNTVELLYLTELGKSVASEINKDG